MKSFILLCVLVVPVCLIADQTRFISKISEMTADDLIDSLSDHGIESRDAEMVIKSSSFHLEEEEPELFIMIGRNIGITNMVTMKELVEKAKLFGHTLCPIGMAPFFALENKEALIICERVVKSKLQKHKSMNYNFAFAEAIENGILPRITGFQITVTTEKISISTLTDQSPVFPDTVVILVR